MQNSLDLKNCLSVFNNIITKGEKSDDVYVLNGIKAWHDFDGYTCFMSYDQVTLTMMFHGKYAIDYPDKEQLAVFEKKLMGFKLE